MEDHRHSRNPLRLLGPAIIVAAVVLGPGSILTSSKVGCQYGYAMLWVLVLAALLMVGMTALAGRLGMVLHRSPCDELAQRAGRGFSVLVGVTIFLIVACFQSSNNIAVLASIESMLGVEPEEAGGGWGVQTLLLLAVNGVVVAAFLGFKQLYQPLERLMVGAVLLMLAAFAANLLFAQPSLVEVLGGFVPSWPFSGSGGWLPRVENGGVIDPLWAVQGLFATTFSIAAAFYQAYLVREKQWTLANAREGFFDSVLGVAALVAASTMILVTSAAVLHGKVDPSALRSASDVADQLKPLFGNAANGLFLLGVLAAAFSSFLVNAMVGGTLLADGLGLGSAMDQRWPRLLTLLAMGVGMGVAIASTAGGMSRVGLIIFAQALTVLGGPILAASLLWLGWQQRSASRSHLPAWVLWIAGVGGLVTLVMALRTAWRLVLQLS